MSKEYIYILGVPNFSNYESSASMIRIPRNGGDINYVCIGEDRLTRLKHTYTFPLRGIDYCLKHFGLHDLEQVDYLATDYARVPRWINSGPAYRKLESDYLKLKLKFPDEKILIMDHHDAHAASCYYPSGFDEAGVLIVDGMGSELNTQTGYHFNKNEMTWSERGYDWGVGRLYSMVTAALLPYGPEKGYGKVMGLAAYGQNKEPSGVNMQGKIDGMKSDYSGFFSRYPISRLTAVNAPQCHDRQKAMEAPFPVIAYEVQEECERALIDFANYINQTTGTKNLCIAGGVGLNGRSNYKILKETPIENVWVQPACSDTGLSFGLAIWAAYQIVGGENFYEKNKISMAHAYCGTPYPASEIEKTLKKYNVKSRKVEPNEVAKLLSEKNVVAVFEGGSEFGPRALGHRSILADPRDPDMKDKLNSSVKFREEYRPYAPVILRDRVSEYFDLECDSPFMLMVADVKKDKYDVIPSVNHVDGTARVQTVTEEDNGNYYKILKSFDEITGVPVLLNTSFNVNREPIVETPDDALICAFGTSIDYLVMDGRLIDCKPYRQPELVTKVTKERNEKNDLHYQALIKKHLFGYNISEMDEYIKEENLIADWHRNYSSKYELEKLIVRWSKNNVNDILVVGTRGHTKCLYMYISGFPNVDISKFIAWDEQPGEKDEFFGIYQEVTKNNIDWDNISEVLISSHEYQREINEWLIANAPERIMINTIYDDACDSLMYVMPSKWPIMNEYKSRKNGLHMATTLQRTASNIDFDFEPTAIKVDERYAVVVNYHYLRGKDNSFPAVTNFTTPENFGEQLRQLSESFTFCRCKDLVDENKVLGESNIVISFDDGGKDIISSAHSILNRYNVPSTFFVCSSPYLENRVLDVHKIQLLMQHLGINNFSKQFYELLKLQAPNGVTNDAIDYAGDYQFYRYDSVEVRSFKLDLNYLVPYAYSEVIIDAIFKKSFGENAEKEIVKKLYLGKDDLKRLVDDGHEIAMHGHSHRVLPRMSFEQQKTDLELSSNFLNSITGEKSYTVAYPFGFSDIYTKRAMKDLKMKAGFGLGREMLTPKHVKERWDLPRFDVNDCFDKQTNDIRYGVFSNLSTGD
ncbi:polysaccharide deacetylase family protein [Amylibacter sp.]|nr:polysaccharide deacetylase family protein [Amylibacter sp.]